MVLPLSFLLTKKKKLVVSRSDQGTFENGRYTPATPKQIIVEANVQPTTKWNDRIILEPGDRSRPMLKVYSVCPLRMVKEGPNGWAADTFVWQEDGQTYEIKAVHPYQMGVMDHYKCIAVRVERT